MARFPAGPANAMIACLVLIVAGCVSWQPIDPVRSAYLEAPPTGSTRLDDPDTRPLIVNHPAVRSDEILGRSGTCTPGGAPLAVPLHPVECGKPGIPVIELDRVSGLQGPDLPDIGTLSGVIALSAIVGAFIIWDACADGAEFFC